MDDCEGEGAESDAGLDESDGDGKEANDLEQASQ